MSKEKTASEEPQIYENDSDSAHRVGEVHYIHNIEELAEVPTMWKKFTSWSEKAGAETIGIQRLPEEARDPNLKPWSTFFIWTTANMHYAAMTTGALGPTLWGLGWWDSFLIAIFFNFFGCAFPALISVIGPETGMRTMVIARYSFGYWANKVIVVLTGITCLGWITINTIAGGGLLLDAWDNKVPLVVIIIIIMLFSVLTTFFGYSFIEKFDRYGWIMQFCIFIILLGVGGKNFTYVPMATGEAERLGCLSYGALIFSWGITWAPMTADYSSYLSEKTSKRSVFFWTLGGNYFGSTLAFILGIAVSSLVENGNPAYKFSDVYDAGGFGALVGAVFLGHGTGVRNFGRFVQTLLGMGIVAANVPNMYSFALDIQAISSLTQRIPRPLVTIVGALAALAISLGLRNNFVDALENFMDLFGYWATPFAGIMLIDHFIVRKRWIPYNVDAWDTPSKLPIGLAASVSFLAGLAVALLCADQTWLVGPIAKAFGGDGADIGFETSFGVVLILYVPLRLLEVQIFRR